MRTASHRVVLSQGKKYLKRADLEALQTAGGEKTKEKEEFGEGSGVVLSPTTPNTPVTPGDDNPVFAIPRVEVRVPSSPLNSRGSCVAVEPLNNGHV